MQWSNKSFRTLLCWAFHFQAAEPKKATPAPAAAAEAAQTVKAKEEPKAKTPETVVDNNPASVASQAGDDAANVPKKLEKRNSIHLFFKHLVRRDLVSTCDVVCLYWSVLIECIKVWNGPACCDVVPPLVHQMAAAAQ